MTTATKQVDRFYRRLRVACPVCRKVWALTMHHDAPEPTVCPLCAGALRIASGMDALEPDA